MHCKSLVYCLLCGCIVGVPGLMSEGLASDGPAGGELARAKAHFLEHYESLGIAPLTLDYRTNLENFGRIERFDAQREFFARQGELLSSAEVTAPLDEIERAVLRFEVQLQLRRLAHLDKHPPPQIAPDKNSLKALDTTGFWYEWLAMKWTGTQLSPDQMLAMGEERLADLQRQIVRTRAELERGPEIPEFIDNPEVLQQRFEARHRRVLQHLDTLFPAHYATPIRIRRGDNEALAQTPGYYNSQSRTFHYNLFDQPYRAQDVDWLLIHEAIPGHHFQFSALETLDLAPFRNAIESPGYAEGWAAYVEQFGTELGLYQTALDRLGMLEWNRVRAVRVVLDVGLNHQGWSRDRAMAYWRGAISDANEIGEREIDRMLRWPGQVHTYVIGGMLIEARWEQYQRERGNGASRRDFHRSLLALGPMPPGILSDIALLPVPHEADRAAGPDD